MKIRHVIVAFLANVFVGGAVSSATAAPVQVNYGDISPDAFEDFEGFAQGTRPGSPVDLGAFTFTAMTPLILENPLSCRGAIGDQCLEDADSISAPRIFNDFAAGANFFGFELAGTGSSDTFDIAVTGSSGMTVFNINGDGLYGFGDTAGLISVAITNASCALGSCSNYSFDDLVLQTSPIPLPAALPLFLTGLVLTGLTGVGVRRRNMIKDRP